MSFLPPKDDRHCPSKSPLAGNPPSVAQVSAQKTGANLGHLAKSKSFAALRMTSLELMTVLRRVEIGELWVDGAAPTLRKGREGWGTRQNLSGS